VRGYTCATPFLAPYDLFPDLQLTVFNEEKSAIATIFGAPSNLDYLVIYAAPQLLQLHNNSDELQKRYKNRNTTDSGSISPPFYFSDDFQ